MIRRMSLAALTLAALTITIGLQAGQATKSSDNQLDELVKKAKDKLTVEQQILLRRFNEFQQQVLQLKERLSRSRDAGDQRKAKALQRVLDRAKNSALSVRFEQLVEFLKKQKFSNITEVEEAKKRARKLADELRDIVDLLNLDDPRDLTKLRQGVEKAYKDIIKAIEQQKFVQLKTKAGRDDNDTLKDAQGKVKEKTDKIADDLKKLLGGKDDKGGTAGKGQEHSDAKSAGKGAGNKGSGKGGEAKTGDSKAGSKGGKAGSQGNAKGGKKSGKGGEGGKAGGKGKGGKGGSKAGGKGKGGKGGSKAGGGKGGKGGSKAGGGKGGKGGDKSAKKGDPGKAGDKSGKGGDKAGAKSGGDKKGASKAGGSKAGGSKAGGSKSSGGKGGKAGGQGKSKGGKGGKGGSKSAGGKGGGKSGGSKAGGSKSGGSKSGGDKSGGQQQSQEQQDITHAKKKVQDASGYEQSAKNKIGPDTPGATEDQDKAIDELEKAKKKLEDLLRQLREEELERLLAALQARCEKMLRMQIRVWEGTVVLNKNILTRPGKKANNLDQKDSLRLSDEEKLIVLEADKAIEMLEAEGSAVAFPEVFKQVREDMDSVRRRLEIVDAGKVTIGIEEDIIETLKEMIEALKKAQEDQKAKKGKPKKSKKGPPQDQKLLDLIAELKMIRAMQARVYRRTKTYGREYEGEQAQDPQIRRELRNLADRQERIVDVTQRIAKGENK